MPRIPSQAAALLALLACTSAAQADSLAVSTPAFSLTFVDFWRLADPPVRDSATQVLGPYNSSAALLTRTGAPSGLQAEILALASTGLSLGARIPWKTLDTMETIGAQTFAVSEWKDTSASAPEPLLRVRSYVLRKGDLAFAAVLLYRSGGCGSVLYTVRTALASLVLKDPAGIRPDRRPDKRKNGPPEKLYGRSQLRDALGRSLQGRTGSTVWGFRGITGPENDIRSSPSTAARTSGQAAPACVDLPP